MSHSSDLAGPGSVGRQQVSNLLTPPPFPTHISPQVGAQGCPHVPTSFLSVLILSLASSIRFASMKSLYLSGSGTRGGQNGAGGTPWGQGPPDAPARDTVVLVGSPWHRAQQDKDKSWHWGLRGVCRALCHLGWALDHSVTGSGDVSPVQGQVGWAAGHQHRDTCDTVGTPGDTATHHR